MQFHVDKQHNTTQYKCWCMSTVLEKAQIENCNFKLNHQFSCLVRTEVRKGQTTVAAFKQSCNNFTANKFTNARIMKHLNTLKV